MAGASGNVGRGIVPLLASSFDFRLAGLHSDDIGGIPVLAADIRRPEEISRLMEGVDAVVNSAIQNWQQSTANSLQTPSTDGDEASFRDGCIEVNVKGAYNLYEASARAGVKKVVFISSLTTILGGEPAGEELPLRGEASPTNFYACTKLFGENLGSVYSKQGMSVICLRLGQPYPMGHPMEAQWIGNPRTRGLLVSFADIARAVKCALLAGNIPFGIFPVVSESDSPFVKEAAVPEIGYEPQTFFTENGMR